MLLGLTGKAGVGKTTLATHFAEIEGYKIRSFAYPLKKSLSVLTGLDMTYFLDSAYKEKVVPWIGKSPRELMQLMGTDFVRAMVNENFWILRMKRTIKSMPPNTNIIIDDVRFENEAAMVRNLGGIVVHLKRDFSSYTKHGNHASENELTQFPADLIAVSEDLSPAQFYRMVSDKVNK